MRVRRYIYLGLVAILSAATPVRAAIQLTNSEGMQFTIDTNGESQGAFYEGVFGGIALSTYTYTSTSTYTTIVTTYWGATYLATITNYTFWYSTTSFTTTSSPSEYGTYMTTSTVSGDPQFFPTSTEDFFDDAYDGSYVLWLRPAGGGAFTPFTTQFGPQPFVHTEEGGREVVIGPHALEGLLVTRKILVPTDNVWTRNLIILHNPTGSEVSVDVSIMADLGSDDEGTRIFDTFSGNHIVTPGERWVVTTQANACCDPHLFHAMDGPTGHDQADIFDFQDGDEIIEWEWLDVTVPAGETKIYAFFAGGRLTAPDAVRTAKRLMRVPRDLTDGMSKAEARQTQNWNFFAHRPSSGGGGNGSTCTAARAPLTGGQAGAEGAVLATLLVGYCVVRRRARR